MALTTEEQKRLADMKARGFTFQQAMSELGGTRIGSPSTVSHLVEQPEAPQKAGYLDSVIDVNAESLNKRVDEFGASKDRYKSGQQGKLETGVQMAGIALATGVIDPLNSIISNIPGAKTVMSTVGKGVDALSKTAPIKFLGGLIGNNEKVAEAVKLYDTDPQFKQTVNSAANIINATLATKGLIEGGTSLVNKGIDLTKKTGNAISNTIDKTAGKYATTPEEISKNIGIKLKNGDTSASIMDRVARVNPKEAQEFEKLSGGETIGKYLARTGNTNAPDKLLQIEAKKFLDSRNSVDDALAQMDADTGKIYADGTIDDAISALQEKAQAVSTKNVPAPFQDDLTRIADSYTTNGGLSMEDINALKRLYERYEKLGYNKLTSSNDLMKATSLDDALRKFQFAQAKANGFSNVNEINKQTQLSRFIVDKLGDKLTGQSGLNAVSLTDWLVLSGANPQAVAGFLTKKIFSSKAIQAKIASMLNDTDSVDIIKPNYAETVPIRDGTTPK